MPGTVLGSKQCWKTENIFVLRELMFWKSEKENTYISCRRVKREIQEGLSEKMKGEWRQEEGEGYRGRGEQQGGCGTSGGGGHGSRRPQQPLL